MDAGAADLNVELPDATTCENGFKQIIHNVSATGNLTVRQYDGTFTGGILKVIEAPVGINDTVAYQFILIDNSTDAGVWYVVELGDAARLRAARFTANFLVADWPAAVSGYRTLTSVQVAGLAAATHDRGTNPIYIIQEKIGTDHDRLMLDRERVNASGDVSLRITTNDAFDGRIILV